LKPKVIAVGGVLPRLLRLENGVLALSSGRPGVLLRFSAKGDGTYWTKPWELRPISSPHPHADTCAYTHLVALDLNSFLIVYSWFLKPDRDGNSRKAIFSRRIRVTQTSSPEK